MNQRLAGALAALVLGCTPGERVTFDDEVALRTPQPAVVARVEPLSPRALPSGIEIADVRIGAGPVAEKGSKVVLGYVGTAEGVEFASSAAKGEPFTFVLGEHVVHTVWEQGIDGMRMGGMRRVWVPPELINGGQGRPPTIPAGVELVFDVELLDVR